MTTHVETETWIGFKIFTGRSRNGFDSFLLETIPRIVATVPHRCWFFLRHIDEDGPHLRLRLLVERDDAPRLVTRVIGDCDATLAELPRRAPSRFVPLIEGGSDFPETASPKVVSFRYEPEYEKYGGVDGTAIVERLFMVSSQISLAVLADDDPNLRKSIAPALMDAVPRAYAIDGDRATYWQTYARYWLGGESDFASQWLRRFAEKAEALHATGYDPLVRPAGAKLEPLLARWDEALAVARAAYAAAGISPSILRAVANNVVHLSNNRLGFLPTEEAYLATVVGAGTARTRAANAS